MKRFIILCIFALVFSPMATFGASAGIAEITPDISCALTGFTAADLYTNSDTTSDFVIVCEVDSNHYQGVKIAMHSANTGHFHNSNDANFTPVNYGVMGATWVANRTNVNQAATNAGYTLTAASSTITLASNSLSNLYQPAASTTEIFRVVPDASADSTLALGTATTDELTLNFEANFISTSTTTDQYDSADMLIAGDYEDTITFILTQLGGTNTTPVTRSIDIEP